MQELPWQEHPTFLGVALKHLVTAQHTGGNFSSHLVRVKGGCAIEEHLHAGKWEMHEVIHGQGKCLMAEKEFDYREGVVAIIPPDLVHTVTADEEDLYILAKFIPALL